MPIPKETSVADQEIEPNYSTANIATIEQNNEKSAELENNTKRFIDEKIDGKRNFIAQNIQNCKSPPTKKTRTTRQSAAIKPGEESIKQLDTKTDETSWLTNHSIRSAKVLALNSPFSSKSVIGKERRPSSSDDFIFVNHFFRCYFSYQQVALLYFIVNSFLKYCKYFFYSSICYQSCFIVFYRYPYFIIRYFTDIIYTRF